MSKQFRLESLEIRNFKGIPYFAMTLNGINAFVFGDNATGKTTLVDSFIWLLFDKDSQNKKDFALKTLNENGEEKHMLEHEVQGVFLLDGKQLTLRKVYSEKWTRKRGSATDEFTGHTTTYYIDGVPVKKKEYEDLIKSIVQEDLFKLLTSPTFFNEQVKWQDRRKTLLEICGDISDEEVIASENALAPLPSILQGRTIENHRKIIAARRAEINKELEKIPVRIDEIQRGLPQLDGLDKQALEAEITILNNDIDDKMTQISSIKNGKAISDKQKLIQEIEMALMDIKREHDSDSKERVYQLQVKTQEEKSNISILTSKAENLKIQKGHNDESLKTIENQLAQLRQEWHEVNKQEFQHTDACECPACGQSLPAEQVDATRENALSQFNLSKAQKLEGINTKGKQGAERKQNIAADNAKLTSEYEKINSQIVEKQQSLEKLNAQLKQQESLVTDILENPHYVAKLQEKQVVEQEIKHIREMSEGAIQDIQMEIMNTKNKRDQLQRQVGQFVLADQSNKRIEELSQQERDLAAEFEKLEQELYLTEEFIRTKVNLLEEKINKKFKYARFNLFKQNINGGLEEVCETTYKGVPYGSGLNNAARINVGLDIINTLSDHYGFSAPIFVDNAEAVTELIDVDTQVIRLLVPPTFDTLPAETKQYLIKLNGSYEHASEGWKSLNKQLRVEIELNEYKEVI
ncbi:AAA family ATPase [Neobacillus sp. MM2021_6]|uniref:AAA family ATPase n=1 Tax=Bacillaceae TaxID=186817 RepID=UPI00140B1E1E|nr:MULTISPECIES: AAA family ATPase [Bacillaceae]MBO0962373.1 AAA family ATPase [Neobacillus sp. MM2021_6]NHC20854.1 AAA family ATPase [Bacillus sp. MM2020_4]